MTDNPENFGELFMALLREEIAKGTWDFPQERSPEEDRKAWATEMARKNGWLDDNP